jgi:hypothetical protein
LHLNDQHVAREVAGDALPLSGLHFVAEDAGDVLLLPCLRFATEVAGDALQVPGLRLVAEVVGDALHLDGGAPLQKAFEMPCARSPAIGGEVLGLSPESKDAHLSQKATEPDPRDDRKPETPRVGPPGPPESSSRKGENEHPFEGCPLNI